ncbi:MAG: hypothetical protein AB1750_10365 [Chloroflexota bacterium]
MKKAVGCSVQLVLLLTVAALLAAPIACIATATAPLHSPELAESFTCPPGTKLVTEWYQATWNEPGEKTLAAWCEDAQGNKLDTLPQDSTMWWSGLKVYFPYAFIPLLVVGALILAVLNALGIAIGSALKKMSRPKGNVQ